MEQTVNQHTIISNRCLICDHHPEGHRYVCTEQLTFVKCPGCSLIWRIHPQEDLTKYNEDNYFTGHYEARRMRRIQKGMKQLSLIEKLSGKKGTLLEIGCSVGYFLEAAKIQGWQPIGIDVGKYAVDKCNSLGLEAHNLSALDLDKINKKFDAIVLRHVFEHLPNPVEHLQIFYQFLEKDGLLFLNMPDGRYFKARMFKEKYKFYSPDEVGLQHYFYYRPSNLKKLLEKNGFKVVLINDPAHKITGKLALAKEFITIARKV